MQRSARPRPRSRADAALAATFRMRVPHLLGQAASAGDRVPPSAVLIVRRLADPLPGTLDPRAPRLSAEWDAALREALGEKYRRAPRPAREHVDPSADAVVFDDTAQLLATVARALVRGEAAACWWWRTYLRALPSHSAAALAALWDGNVRDVPRALALLVERGEAAEVLAPLEPARALALARSIVETYELTALRAVITSRHAGLDRVADATAERTPSSTSSAFAGLIEPALAGTAAAGLAIEQRMLLLVAIAIVRAPAFVRRAEFAAIASGWIASQAERSRALPETPPAAVESRRTASAPTRAVKRVEQPAAAPNIAPQRTAGAPRASFLRPAAPVASPPDVAHDPGTDTKTDDESPEIDEAVDAAGTATGLGGVFFLLNVFRSLDLLTVLDEHFEAECSFGPWGWLELVARGLIPIRRAPLADDPVWQLLAELDGREPGTPLSDDFMARPQAGLPAAWAKARNRATPNGRSAVPLLGRHVSQALAGVLAVIVPYVRRRLCRALGIRRGDLPGVLLQREARVFVAASNVDITMSIETVRLPIRLAGLDADPGWMPAFGRIVRFHYR